eukprot:5541871-Prymnesium_polylepis.1
MLSLRPEQRLGELEARIDAAKRQGEDPVQLLEWRQQAQALVKLTFPNDVYQTARASTMLADAHLEDGNPQAALGHARSAEALLTSPQCSALVPR